MVVRPRLRWNAIDDDGPKKRDEISRGWKIKKRGEQGQGQGRSPKSPDARVRCRAVFVRVVGIMMARDVRRPRQGRRVGEPVGEERKKSKVR